MSIAQGIYVRVSIAQIAESVRIKNLFRERLVASRLLWSRILHVTPCVKKSVKIYWSKSGFNYYESGMCMDSKIWCLFLFLCIGCHVYILTFSLSPCYRINFTIYENRSHDQGGHIPGGETRASEQSMCDIRRLGSIIGFDNSKIQNKHGDRAGRRGRC